MTETREDVIEDIKQGIANIAATGDRVRKDIISTDRLVHFIILLVGITFGFAIGLAIGSFL